MTLGQAMRVSQSGMTAERFRMDVISANIANANTISTPGQEAYRARRVILSPGENGVQIQGIEVDNSPLVGKYEPNNPYRNADDMVFYSNVEPLEQMVDMVGASRAYEANIASFNSIKGMIRAAMTIGRT